MSKKIYMLLCFPLLMPTYVTATAQNNAAIVPQSGKHLLQQHRDNVRHSHRTVLQVAGNVATIDSSSQILTNITSAALSEKEIQTSDLVNIAVLGKTLRARIIDTDQYNNLLLDEAMRGTFDVDVVGVISEQGGSSNLTIIGLGGELADWLKVRVGSRIIVTKSIFR